jgi:hypothetical protein
MTSYRRSSAAPESSSGSMCGCCSLAVVLISLRNRSAPKVRVQHLDGHVALVPQVVREVHGGHAASTEFTLHAVAVGEGGGEALRDLGHVVAFGLKSATPSFLAAAMSA